MSTASIPGFNRKEISCCHILCTFLLLHGALLCLVLEVSIIVAEKNHRSFLYYDIVCLYISVFWKHLLSFLLCFPSFSMTPFLTCCSHIYLGLPLGHFAFIFMFRTFLEILPWFFLETYPYYFILLFNNLSFNVFVPLSVLSNSFVYFPLSVSCFFFPSIHINLITQRDVTWLESGISMKNGLKIKRCILPFHLVILRFWSTGFKTYLCSMTVV
jgi:hypothetical protein